MPNKLSNHQRHSIPLINYDYSQSGFYFITICTWKHLHLFGEIENECMSVSKYGEIAIKEWFRTQEIRPNINLHEFIIMPSHLHGIIEIIKPNGAYRVEQFGKPSSNTIPTIIRSYKASVTKQSKALSNDTYFHIWQRNYYEHIIRSEKSYLKISEYIQTNPLKWRLDKYFG